MQIKRSQRLHSLFWAVVILGTAVSQAGAVDATVTDINGASTKVSDLHAHLHDSCKGFRYYLDAATETDAVGDSIILSVQGNRYQVSIPLELIKSVKRSVSNTGTAVAGQATRSWAVVLSDDTTLVGEVTVFDDLRGKAELGDYSIPWTKVSQLIFSSPLKMHETKTSGTRAVTLYMNDDEKLALTGAAFISEARNRNGCFSGFTHEEGTRFETDGGGGYDITLDKIGELRFGKTRSSPAAGNASIELISPSGTAYSGKIHGLGVEGMARIGIFDLLVTVPFTSSAEKLMVNGK